MSIAIFGWQIFIFFTIVVSGKKAGWVSLFWVVWTVIQVYGLPLSVIQFITIFVAYKIASKGKKRDKI
jgi:DNA helicase-4